MILANLTSIGYAEKLKEDIKDLREAYEELLGLLDDLVVGFELPLDCQLDPKTVKDRSAELRVITSKVRLLKSKVEGLGMVRKHLPWIFNKTDEAGDLEMQIGRFQADTINTTQVTVDLMMTQPKKELKAEVEAPGLS